MAYVTPSTRTTGTLITAAIWNQDVVANAIALHIPPRDLYDFNEASDYSTSSTSFADVDTTDLTLTVVTVGGDVEVTFFGNVSGAATTDVVYFDFTIDGTRFGGDDGLCAAQVLTTNAPGVCVGFNVVKQGLSAASHTFALQWKVGSGDTVALRAGAGAANGDLHPQFRASER